MIKFLPTLLLLSLALPSSATTIAFDGKTVAADSQITMGESKALNGHKLVRINGCVVGCAGDVVNIDKFKRWFRDQKQPKPKLSNQFVAIVVAPGGLCTEYFSDLTCTTAQPPHAIGTGSDCARAAMAMGASAKRAVEIARDIDLYTGGTIVEMTP